MSISYFVHYHGSPGGADALRPKAQGSLSKLAGALPDGSSLVLHSPLAVPGSDPLPVEQDARMLLCQLRLPAPCALEQNGFGARARKCFAAIATGDGVHDVHSHAMTTEYLKPGSPDDNAAAAQAVSFFVQYDGPAKDPAAFHAYYRAHHVPIVFRMPGIRSVTYYLPTGMTTPVAGRAVSRLQIVQAVFDTAEDFLRMRQSSERKEGLRDFDNYPPFEGPVTHQVMHSVRIAP